MSKFKVLLEAAGGEEFVPDMEFINALAAAYDEDIAGLAGDSEVWTEEKLAFEAALQERDAVISQLKSHNYDLLMQVPASEPETANSEDSDESDDGPDIDDLFEDEE